MLYWNIGKRINDELLQNRRADYGEQIQCRLLKDWRLQVASAIFYFCLFIGKMPRHSKLLGEGEERGFPAFSNKRGGFPFSPAEKNSIGASGSVRPSQKAHL